MSPCPDATKDPEIATLTNSPASAAIFQVSRGTLFDPSYISTNRPVLPGSIDHHSSWSFFLRMGHHDHPGNPPARSLPRRRSHRRRLAVLPCQIQQGPARLHRQGGNAGPTTKEIVAAANAMRLEIDIEPPFSDTVLLRRSVPTEPTSPAATPCPNPASAGTFYARVPRTTVAGTDVCVPAISPRLRS